MNDREKNWKPRAAFWSKTELYHVESHNWLLNAEQKKSSEGQRSKKRKWRRHTLFSLSKTHCPEAKHWSTPSCTRGAAPWSTLQDYTWTEQIPGLCVCVWVFDEQCQGQFLPQETFIRLVLHHICSSQSDKKKRQSEVPSQIYSEIRST